MPPSPVKTQEGHFFDTCDLNRERAGIRIEAWSSAIEALNRLLIPIPYSDAIAIRFYFFYFIPPFIL